MKTYPGHVYVMATQSPDIVKVGFSCQPLRRAVEHKHRHGPLRVVHKTAFYADARAIEKAAHKLLRLAGKRIRGELFLASLEEAIAAIDEAERLSSVPLAEPKRVVPFNMRTDDAFVAAVRELRRLSDDIPSQSEVVRRAVLEALERKRKERRK